mgnify:CR=1 FL=1
MEKVDSIVIGGGMSYTFAAAQGGKVGNSLCEPEMFPTALEIVKKAEERGVKLVFSPDALIADKFAEDADTRQAPVNDIPDGGWVSTSARRAKRLSANTSWAAKRSCGTAP